MTAHSFLSRLLLGIILTLGASAAELKAEDRKFQAQLIWGTDMEKPDGPELKKVNAELGERLQKVFKWKFYFEVKDVKFVVPEKGTKKVTLSKKCDIEVRDLGKPMVEAKLFGEGKLVKTVKQAAAQSLVIAGDDRNDTAWFVVLTPQ